MSLIIEKNDRNKKNLNKINLNDNEKSNTYNSDLNDKILDFNKSLNVNNIKKKSIKIVDMVKPGNESESNQENEINDSINSAKISRYKIKNSDIHKTVKIQNIDNKFKLKNIYKDDEVDEKEETEKIDEEQEKKNLRQIFGKFFTIERMSILQLIISILSTISCIFYVVCTYEIKLFKYMNYFDIVILIYFVFYNFIEIVLAYHRLLHIFSWNFLAQVITIIPAFLCFITDDYITSYTYMIVNACRVFRFHLITKNINYFGFGKNNKFTKQILVIVYPLFNIIFITAGLMQLVERTQIGDLQKIQTDPLSQLQLKLSRHFHHYLYYTIVTISTVGYGDISPNTFLGKFIFIILDFMILAVIPRQINDLIILILSQSIYARNSYRSKNDISHILLVGSISTESLKSFCQEFFHPNHGSQFRHAVILNQGIPSRDMEAFLHRTEIKNFVFYLEGDPFNERDLLRADAQKAKACIIFNDKNSKDPFSGDQQCILLGTFIKKFVYNHNLFLAQKNLSLRSLIDFSNFSFHLCLQLNKPNCISHFYSCFQPVYKRVVKQDQLIIMESLKMNLLSKSCITPGIMTLVSNLIMTYSDEQGSNEEEWMKEFSEGRKHEIYRIQLKEYYYQFSFIEIVQNIYDEGQVIVFALEIEVEGATILKLNPTNCSDLKLKDIIEKGKKFNYKSKKEEDSYEFGDISERKDFYGTANLNSKSEVLTLKAKENSFKVFAYLICSDKFLVDNVANKEKNNNDNNSSKEVSKNDNMNFNNNMNNNIKNNMSPSKKERIYNIKKNSNSIDKKYSKEVSQEKIPIFKSSESNNKGIFKELIRNINQNLNMQMAIMDNDASSESEEDIDNENLIHCGFFTLEVSDKDYHLNKEKIKKIRNTPEIVHHSIRECEDISHHIIICGFHPALLHFILPLRAKYLQEDALKWIIILAPSLPSSLLEAFTRFNRIIYIQGSPLLPEDLFRANIINADKAVILSSGDSKINNTFDLMNLEQDNKYDKQSLDDETILIYKLIKKCNKNIQIMTELIYTSNIEYLLDTDNIQQLSNQKGIYDEYEFTRLYASGEIFTPKFIDCLTCQSYYNPHIVNIIELLLGGKRYNTDTKIKKLEEYYGLNNSNLYLIKVKEAHINEAFMDFYYFVLRHNSIAIALYRKNENDEFYYVYTNPKKTTLLRENDYVFILSNNEYIFNLIGERFLNDDESNFSWRNNSIENNNINRENLNSFNSSNDERQDNEEENASKNESNNFGNNIKLYEEDDFNNKIKMHQKNINFERTQERLNKILNDLEKIKLQFEKFPDFIDDTIDKELENEMKIYLNNQ